MAKRAARQKNQLPPCYYEGYLEKRSFKDKTSRKLWTCLCGNTLFFFNDKRDADYIEKVELSGMLSITDDGSQDRNLDAARLNLQMKDQNIKFTAPNAEARELWKGYIQSVAELSVPISLNLLPGQIHMLKEAVEKETERIQNATPAAVTKSTSPYISLKAVEKETERIQNATPAAVTKSTSPYISLEAEMPACYHAVTRMESELLLEREAARGNLLLRPSNGHSFAVTTRQDLEGSVFRHYRVTRKHDGGFAIDVDNPVPCATLHDVVNYLLEKTDGVLIPLILEEAYEKNISFIRSNKENGEREVQQAPVPPSLPPRPAVPLRIPTPEPAPADEQNMYLNEKPEKNEKESEDSSADSLPQLEKNGPRKAIMPPVATPRRLSSPSPPTFSSTTTTTSSSSSSTSSSAPISPRLRMRTFTEPRGQIPLAAMSELKLKLEQQKARCQE